MLALLVRAAAIAVAVSALDGCSSKSCTDVACSDSLTLKLAAVPPGSIVTACRASVCWTATLDAQGNAPYARTSDGFLFLDVDPGPWTDACRVRIDEPDGTIYDDTRGPSGYRTVQPNGEGCPPTCRIGEIDFTR